ncbi:hypothetical protein Vi05172_g5159 [Venturia inaequalis]|nr:hypothetical protein Vi05172_g5159 [Venturia inaequalis]
MVCIPMQILGKECYTLKKRRAAAAAAAHLQHPNDHGHDPNPPLF